MTQLPPRLAQLLSAGTSLVRAQTCRIFLIACFFRQLEHIEKQEGLRLGNWKTTSTLKFLQAPFPHRRQRSEVSITLAQVYRQVEAEETFGMGPDERHLRLASTQADFQSFREMALEYSTFLGVDLSFQVIVFQL
jgi:hypothetical protein